MEMVRDTGFIFHMPESLPEALKLLAQYGESAKIMAGGTDLIPRYKAGVIFPKHVVNIAGIKELDYLEHDGGRLRIGASRRLREIEGDKTVKEKYTALQQGIHSMASTQIRNVATVAGNICNAIPSADTAPALLALNAKVHIINTANQERTVMIEDFFTGVCKTVLLPNEMVREIEVPQPEDCAFTQYYKSTIRNGLDLAMTGVAVNIVLDGGKVSDVRIGLGAVAPVPKRAYHAENYIKGMPLTEECIEETAKIASEEDCRPISDIRASQEYRRKLVRLSVRDGFYDAMRRDKNETNHEVSY